MKLNEVRSNTHQQHLESLVIFGKEGLDEINHKIENFINKFTDNNDNLITTTKIDGSPAVICWSSIEGYPDNSIALKGFVNGPQTSLSSDADIEAKYGDRPDMAEKLKWALKLAKYIPQGQAWQGDCLFSKNDLREEEILGKDYITFQPNKIIYAFSEDNPGYNQVKNADFGIAFHTIYTKSGDGLKQSFRINLDNIDAPSNFYLLSPAINASTNAEDYSLEEIKNKFNQLKEVENKLINDPAYEELVNNQTFINYWNTFENKMLADNKATNINVNTLVKDLTSYINDKLEKEYNKKVNTLKTDDAKLKAKDRFDSTTQQLSNLIEDNKDTLQNIVTALNLTADIKMMMWEGFKKSKQDYSTFYKSKTKGHFVADPEGIAMSDDDGNIVKLVDRSAFSSYNRDDDIESGWEHRQIEEFAATQRGDMGSFGKFNKLLLDEDVSEKVAVVAFGRFNPPTIGHRKLVQKMVDAAKGEKPKVYLSHKVNSKSDPLSYESKVRWAQKEWGDLVDVVRSDANNPWDVLKELYEQGYTDIIYAGGDDRIGGAGDIYGGLTTNDDHNEYVTRSGDVWFKFNSINPLNAGKRDVNSSNIEEQASASLVRRLATEKNFNEFKKYVYLNEKDAKNLFDELRYALKDNVNFVEKYLREAKKEVTNLNKNNYTPEMRRKLDKELDKVDKSLDAPNPDWGANDYMNNVDEYTGLYVKQTGSPSSQQVVYNTKDIIKLHGDDGEKINRELDTLRIEDEDGNKFRINPTGSPSVMNGKATLVNPTFYQEAIYALVLTGKVKKKDLITWLRESDVEDNSGIFKYINTINYNKNTFKNEWSSFIDDWGKTFEIAQSNSAEFMSKISEKLKNANKAIILHPGVKSNYDAIADQLLKGMDDIDKSDFYLCSGDVRSITSKMLELRRDPAAYTDFMLKNTDKILGISLKKVSSSMNIEWDIPAKKANYFKRAMLRPSDKTSQVIYLYGSDGSVYDYNIRTNSKKGAITMELKEHGSTDAQMGKATKAFDLFAASTPLQSKMYLQDKCKGNTQKMALTLLRYITGNNSAKPGKEYDLTKDGAKFVSRIINVAAGFQGTNAKGQRITAPYIKVY